MTIEAQTVSQVLTAATDSVTVITDINTIFLLFVVPIGID